MTTPRDSATDMESHPVPPPGDDERFVGRGVLPNPGVLYGTMRWGGPRRSLS